MTTRLLLLSLLALSGCATLQDQWPKPNLVYTHQPDHAFAQWQVRQWCDAAQGHTWSHALRTGSMRPYLFGGANEYYLLEAYTGQPIYRGDVVVYARQSLEVQYDYYGVRSAWLVADPSAQNCMHMVNGLSPDKRYLLLDGVANRTSDAYQKASDVKWIVRGVVTAPEGAK
jgi:hypothetical protein